ncbi:hypothetical protein TW65_86995 [Stemphylium lycopersici]|nr:hypothetical protein TW65_86995 [Stemphylium lycopersici]
MLATIQAEPANILRIAQVEQKIDGLVAKLVNAADNELPSDSTSVSPSVTPETRTEIWRRQRTVAPGSWMPTPSFDPIASHFETHVERPPENAEADRQYLEGIRLIHRVGDRETPGQIPEGPFRQSKQREEPIDDELIRDLFASGKAELLMNEYRHMSTTFPFVIIPPCLTSIDLHAERPMLFLALMVVASWKDHPQQKKLDVIYRAELAHRTIVQPRRTLGLVQSVLVYLSWVGTALQKPNLLKHTPAMAEMAQTLNQEREYESDEAICHLISLRQIDDQIQDTLFTTEAAQLSLSDGRTSMHMRFMEAQLDIWKTNLRNVTAQRSLRPHMLDCPQPPNSAQIDSLYSTLEAGRTFLDTLLSFQTHEYHLVSFSEWMRLPAVIMTVAKLCMPSDDHISCGWDVQAAQDRPHTDFWRAMRYIIDLTKDWYVRKIRPPLPIQTPPETTHGVAAGPSISDASCPISGPSTDSSAHQTGDQFNAFADMDFMAEAGTEPDTNSNNSDPFAIMKGADFDMEQFFDMAGGIWGDQSYNSYSDMAFGGSATF